MAQLAQQQQGGCGRRDSEPGLWAAFQADPGRGLESIYDRYAPLVFGLASKTLHHKQDAEDLTQEVFVSLLHNCPYDPARGSLGAYLATVTRSRAIDRIRAQGRSLRLLNTWVALDAEAVDVGLPGDAAVLEENAVAVRAALATLGPKPREALELAYFRGLTQAEIASELDAPLGTVKTWIRQAMLTLREALRDHLDT
jgi:RNA polymerase sigma-70 factor, ECF subfamily